MCYINGVKVTLEEFIRYKREQKMVKDLAAAKLFYQPVKRAFDYTEWPIIRIDGFGNWEAIPAEWGIIPPWIKTRDEAKTFRFMYPTYNAIGEEIFEKKSFSAPVRKHRCLVPSSYFFEFMHVPKIGKKGQPLKATDKIPYCITVIDKPLFYFAGIYSPWFDKERDDFINTFSIVTQPAGFKMEVIHNIKKRQPVILTDELCEVWTDKLNDNQITEIVKTPFDNHLIQGNTISKDFLTSENPEEAVYYDNAPEMI